MVKEGERVERCLLRIRGYMPLCSQPRHEGFDLCASTLLRVALMVKIDKSPNPEQIGLFCAQAAAAQANFLSDIGVRFPGDLDCNIL